MSSFQAEEETETSVFQQPLPNTSYKDILEDEMRSENFIYISVRHAVPH